MTNVIELKPVIRLSNSINLYVCYEKKNLSTFPGFGKTPYEAFIDYYSRPSIDGYPYCGLVMDPIS